MNKKEQDNKAIRYLLWGGVIFVILVIAYGGGDDISVTQEQQEVVQIETQEFSSAFKLASIEIGYNDPPQSLVDEYESLLGRLSRKCPNESEEQIAGYVFKGKEIIEEKGGSITLMEVGEGIDGSIPEEAIGVVTCAEIAAAFVTLVTGN